MFTGLMLAAACYAGDGRLLEPGDSSSQPGDVKKKGLTLTVVTDSALAAALGWESNVVVGAEVIVQRGPDPGDRDTVVSDENGVVKLESLVPGDYKVWGSYLLDTQEMVAAEASGIDVRVLGGALRSKVPSKGILKLFQDEPGSLVVSQIEFVKKLVPGVSDYRFGGYVQLYNNSDTTIYLDGKLIGSGYVTLHDHEALRCNVSAWRRIDAEGIWGIFFEAFPGAGTDYPLQPGHTVLVARDAIDHTALHDGTLDLSDADFEFYGYAEVDNPTVPNMVDVGLRPVFDGHGLLFPSQPVVFVAEPVDVSSLQPHKLDNSGVEVVRIPTDKILDVTMILADFNTVAAYGNPECPLLIHPVHDRMEGHIGYGESEEDWDLAIHRRVAGVRSDGRVILQRTRTTALDFCVAPRSPWRIR